MYLHPCLCFSLTVDQLPTPPKLHPSQPQLLERNRFLYQYQFKKSQGSLIGPPWVEIHPWATQLRPEDRITMWLLLWEPCGWKGGKGSLLEGNLSSELRGGVERQISRYLLYLLSHHEDCRIFLQILLQKLSEYYSHPLWFARTTDSWMYFLPLSISPDLLSSLMDCSCGSPG